MIELLFKVLLSMMLLALFSMMLLVLLPIAVQLSIESWGEILSTLRKREGR